MFWRAFPLVIATLSSAFAALGQEPGDYYEEENERWVIRSAGGVLGLVIENFGAMDISDFERFAVDALPPVKDDLSSFYFGINSTAFGIALGPRLAIARMRNGLVDERGWTMHLGIDPHLFFLYFSRDHASNDTLYTTEYLYTMSQLELALGGGPYWRSRPSRSFFLLGGFNAELGTTAASGIHISGTETIDHNGDETPVTFMDKDVQAHGCTYLRAYAIGEAGFRIRKRVDLSARVQVGTGLMWLHDEDVRPILSSMVFALHMQYLIRR